MNPNRAEILCKALAEKINERLGENAFDLVVAPAMGGVIVGYEVARQLGLESIFCERVNGIFELRRGFNLEQNARVLVVEDVITTGKSSLETYDLVRKLGGIVAAEASLVDRSGDDKLEEKMGVPVISLIKLDIRTFAENEVPEDLKGVPAVKPGSRFLK